MVAIEDARAACDDNRWGDAYRLLSSVELETLTIDDLDRLGDCGLPHRSRRGRVRVLGPGAPALHRRRLHPPRRVLRDSHRPGLVFKGDLGRCRGWVDRGARLLDEAQIDCVEQGYLSYGLGMMCLFEAGDIAGARGQFAQAGKVGARFAHRELVTVARIAEARMMIYLGEIVDGMAMLDEAMVSIEARETHPVLDRRRVLHGHRRLRGAVRRQPVPDLDGLVRALVRHATGLSCSTAVTASCTAPRCWHCRARGRKRSSKLGARVIVSPRP
jgi:hypothetical protein